MKMKVRILPNHPLNYQITHSFTKSPTQLPKHRLNYQNTHALPKHQIFHKIYDYMKSSALKKIAVHCKCVAGSAVISQTCNCNIRDNVTLTWMKSVIPQLGIRKSDCQRYINMRKHLELKTLSQT
jgi:hypothetical protein